MPGFTDWITSPINSYKASGIVCPTSVTDGEEIKLAVAQATALGFTLADVCPNLDLTGQSGAAYVKTVAEASANAVVSGVSLGALNPDFGGLSKDSPQGNYKGWLQQGCKSPSDYACLGKNVITFILDWFLGNWVMGAGIAAVIIIYVVFFRKK